jgi:uncharacterized protein
LFNTLSKNIKMFQRPYFQLLASRLEEPRGVIQVIAGPRQVGKTTLVGQLLSASNTPSHFVSADGTVNASTAWMEQQWETARIKLRHSEASTFILAVDEIQKIPNWSETVKANWDACIRGKYLLLTKSSGNCLTRATSPPWRIT